jgi:phosphohistidine swiveling domain-containing protein
MIFENTAPQDLLKRLEDKGWYRHGIYRTTLIWAVELVPGLDKESFELEGIGRGMENAIQTSKGEFFIVQEEFDAFCELYDAKLEDGIPYLKRYITDYNRDMDASLEENKKIGSIDPTKLSDEELGNSFLAYFKAIWPLHHWLWSMEFLNESFDKKIHSLMKKAYPAWSAMEIDAFLGNASYTFKRQFFQKEQEEIVALGGPDDPKAREVFERYKWLKMYFIDGNPFSSDEYKVRISEFLKGRKEIQDQIRKSREDAEAAKRLVETVEDEELKEYLYLMQELSYLKTYRIDIYTITASYITGIRNEIIRRLGISPEEFNLHTRDEIVSALKGKPLSSEELASREKYCVVKLDGVYAYLKGPKALEAVRKAIWDDSEKLESFGGTIAYKGVVRGRVKVSFSSHDIGKIDEGDILVCNLTNPDYNPVFKKVAGIVTDEGGVLCHSAIMAREFKIPCIIGTKIATKVLKDGDMVEVDADKGIVRIIK